MRTTSSVLLALVCALGMASAPTRAQSWDSQQTEVWQAVSKTWEMGLSKDLSWISDMTTANVSGWSTGSPAPRGREAIIKWSRLSDENGKTLAYELAPLSIAIAGDTAIAHYYYSEASEDKDGKRETSHGYCSDTLVKQGGKWLFLGWNCGDIPAKK